MSKAIIISDLHIHDYQNFNRKGERLANCLRVLDDVFAFADKHQIKTIIFGGDLFDTPKVLLTVVIHKAVERFKVLFDAYPDIKFYVITGNHDQPRKNLPNAPAGSSTDYLASVFPDNFINFDNTVKQVTETAWIWGIPYYEHPEHYSKVLDDTVALVQQRNDDLGGDGITETVVDYLFIHQTPVGIGNKMIATDTDPTDERYGAFNHVYCGHIHKRMQLAENFTVIGSPIHRDFGDAGETKGFLVVNLDKPEKKAVFIPLEGYPTFQTRYEDEAPLELEAENYVRVKPVLHISSSVEDVEDAAKFDTSLENEQIVTHYWEAVDGKDEELLKIGLSLLK